MNDTLKRWLRAATSVEQIELAEAVGTSTNVLEQYACKHRMPSAERAIAIELAAAPITRRSKGRLPRLLRTDMATACASCEYARRCLGMAAVASEFDAVKEGGE
jgi:transcriptional regulator with XRE-family HTH domain